MLDKRLERLVERKSNRYFLEGKVTEVYRDAITVDLGNHEIVTRLAGPMQHFKIKVLPEDVVVVVPSQLDTHRGRIIWRK
jgi:translation initiation factor IF-1